MATLPMQRVRQDLTVNTRLRNGKDDELVGFLPQKLFGLSALGRPVHGIAQLVQAADHDISQILCVFNDENAHYPRLFHGGSGAG
jgi:hypothetical protein